MPNDEFSEKIVEDLKQSIVQEVCKALLPVATQLRRSADELTASLKSFVDEGDGQAIASSLPAKPILGQIFSRKKIADPAYIKMARAHARRVRYAMPALLVAFPRSGSNHLQAVLEGSSGLICNSIYGGNYDSSLVLCYKSHATSYEYLMDEIQRLKPDMQNSKKIILLIRDPRDVMISFYEFTQNQRQAKIPQCDFLENYSFFLASTIDKLFKRKVDTAPLSVLQAYKKHIDRWHRSRRKSLDILTVRYEDLVEKPRIEFQRIFDFLGLDCTLNEEFLGIKVSLYSDETRKRGITYGWKSRRKRNGVLIDKVNRLLKDEIDLLGY